MSISYNRPCWHYYTTRSFLPSLLGKNSSPSYLLLPAITLVAPCRSMFFALVDTLLVEYGGRGFQSLTIDEIEPKESVVLFSSVITAVVADFLEMRAEDGIVDLDGRRCCGYISHG